MPSKRRTRWAPVTLRWPGALAASWMWLSQSSSVVTLHHSPHKRSYKPCCTLAGLQRRWQRCAARGVTSTRRVPGPPLAAAQSTPASGGAVSLQLQLTNAHASSHGSDRTLQLASSPCGCGARPSEACVQNAGSTSPQRGQRPHKRTPLPPAAHAAPHVQEQACACHGSPCTVCGRRPPGR